MQINGQRNPRFKLFSYDLRTRWLACALWAVVLVVPCVLIVLGRIRSIPFREYMGAGQRWLSHEPLYDLGNIDGFQYFPQAALLFAPLAWLGSPVSDLLWRALGWTAYAFAVWRWIRQLSPRRADQAFLLATVFALGPAVSNLVNGQANLLIAALALHASLDVAERHWWRASALLAFGLALKPLMGIPLLLAWVLYAPLRWRVPLALALAFAAPWLFADHAYLAAQWAACVAKLRLSADPDRLFEDLRGFVSTLGLSLSAATYTALRALAALATLALAGRAKQQLAEPRASFAICALGLTYLMLFNPRTLSSSYVMPGACAALLGAQYILQRAKVRALVVLGIVFAWTLNHHVVPWVEYWLRPLASMVFAGLLMRELFAAQTACRPDEALPVAKNLDRPHAPGSG